VDDARKQFADVLIVDTAGRLAIDQEMMDEIARLHAELKPIETLFVVDAMTGQDAANTAKAFAAALPLTGVVLTKTDGDARGGAALSVRYVTGRPIKFVGAGEKVEALEAFHPERAAGRILGMGDVVSLVEDVTRKVDQDKAAKLAEKVVKGKRFDMNDMRDQLEQMLNMGGLGAMMDKLPGMGQLPDAMKSKVNDKEVKRMVAIIQSMTKKERPPPGPAERLAQGAGGSRLGHPAPGHQPPAQAVPADGQDDVQAAHGGHEGPDAAAFRARSSRAAASRARAGATHRARASPIPCRSFPSLSAAWIAPRSSGRSTRRRRRSIPRSNSSWSPHAARVTARCPIPGAVARCAWSCLRGRSIVRARRTRPLDAARGDWLNFLDDDDELFPQHVSALLAAASRESGARVLYSSAELRDLDGRVMGLSGRSGVHMQLYNQNRCQPVAALIARSLVQEGARFDPRFEVLEDQDFFVACATRTRFAWVDAVTCVWHGYAGDSGCGYGPNADATRRQAYLELLRAKWASVFETWKREPEALLYLGQHHLREGDLEVALSCLEQALAARPDDPNALNLCGMANHHAGNRARAAELLEAALRRVPGHPAIRANLELVRRGG
jgi:hypothetical protein